MKKLTILSNNWDKPSKNQLLLRLTITNTFHYTITELRISHNNNQVIWWYFNPDLLPIKWFKMTFLTIYDVTSNNFLTFYQNTIEILNPDETILKDYLTMN